MPRRLMLLPLVAACAHPAPPPVSNAVYPADPKAEARSLLADGPEPPRDFELAADVRLSDDAAEAVAAQVQRLAPALVDVSGIVTASTARGTPTADGFLFDELTLALGEVELHGLRVSILFSGPRALVAAVYRPGRRASHVVYAGNRVCIRYFTADVPGESLEGLACRDRA